MASMVIDIPIYPGISVISRLSPKTQAKLRSQATTGYHMSKWDITGLYPI